MINPQMIKKIQKMQEDLKKAQAEINASTFYGQAGGSVVKVAVKGNKEVISIDIKKDEIDLTDIEMVQDMIVAALNDAFKKVDKELEETIGSITQGMQIPGLF
ncbi:MAG TPA: YbaB/EbfC family nucleoid-associated protein [Bacillota bacterium]|nr:YbaB/EbfC family nucleoid-associated protein [Bacillota bacterium]HPF42962.1 YbaB/EbfC family nucleoid-associated protein [Bacillota bacterium]HPJ86412.1 YbaB/EbfC family nucleoid-associated protein [Bacillota bacterium]HPQ62426.1 YbaB/EbfC family nucleoid-associated protein [Bacillota bacterium]